MMGPGFGYLPGDFGQLPHYFDPYHYNPYQNALQNGECIPGGLPPPNQDYMRALGPPPPQDFIGGPNGGMPEYLEEEPGMGPYTHPDMLPPPTHPDMMQPV